MRNVGLLWFAFAVACSSAQSSGGSVDSGPAMHDASPPDASVSHMDAGRAMDSGSVHDAQSPTDSGSQDASKPGDAEVKDAAAHDAATHDAAQPGDMDAMQSAIDAGSDASMPVHSIGLCANCAVGEKLCTGLCVSSSDPTYGCGGSSCTACNLAHATAGCSGSACAVTQCDSGWADCDHDVTNGCEADLSDPGTCGACNVACGGGTNLCSPGGCVSACTPPLTLCGSRCVNLSTSPANCGACNNACSVNGSMISAYPSCAAGTCADGCRPGFSKCDSTCVDLTRTPAYCGDCSTHCTSDQECVNSSCVTARCQIGMTRCGSTCVATQLDASNCGACGHACGTDERCIDSQCVNKDMRWITTGLSMPADLAIDGDKVYWTDIGDNTIKRMAVSGGTVEPLAHDQAKPIRPVIDDTYVYWSNNLGGAIMRAPKAGGSDPEIVSTATSPGTFVLDSDYLYFSSTNTIQRVTKSGGTSSPFVTMNPTVGASVQLSELVSDGTYLYVFRNEIGYVKGIWRVALSDASAMQLYYIDTPTALPMQPVGAALMVANGQQVHHVDFVDTGDGTNIGTLYSSPAELTSSLTLTITAFVANSCGVFWTEGTSLYLSRLNAATSLKLTDGSIRGLALDSQHIYWSDGSGAIGRLPLPSQ